MSRTQRENYSSKGLSIGNFLMIKSSIPMPQSYLNCPFKLSLSPLFLFLFQVYQLLRLPCRFAAHGCPALIILKEKSEHEAYCCYRPIHCHYSSNGCDKVMTYQEIHKHVPLCEYKDAQQNILPWGITDTNASVWYVASFFYWWSMKNMIAIVWMISYAL